MRADLDWQLKVITSTTLHPDIILWSSPMRTVVMVELTVPCKDGMDSGAERRRNTPIWQLHVTKQGGRHLSSH